MSDTIIKVENISKFYQLGLINHGTLAKDLQGWWAKIRGREDPNSQVSLLNSQNNNSDNDFIYALKDVSFDVKQGEVLGIIGANGAGKSTLLKILSRVTSPTSGCIKIKGRIGSLLEVGTGFHPELTGRENIYLNGAILGMRKHEIDRKLDEIIDFSGVEKFIDTPVKRYSSGMYVRLAFAVAAHLDPEILVVDEVLAVGDADFQKKCLGKMDDVSKKEGRTVLFVSHNMAAVRQLCTRGILLRNGELVFDGETEKAINTYMESNINLKTHYCFDDQRRSVPERGRLIFIHTFDIIGKLTAKFAASEIVQFTLSMEGKDNLSDLRVRLEIRTIDGTNVGMSESKALISIKKGEFKCVNFGYDISNLAEGLYTMRLTLFKLNEMGYHKGFDETTEKILFEVVEDDKDRTNWLPQYWGRVKLPPVITLSDDG